MIRKIFINAFVILILAGAAHAQGSTCTITGTVIGGDNQVKSGVRLTITPLLANGLLVHTASYYSSFSDVTGVLTFTAIQGARYNIKGNALLYTGTGRNVTIPETSSATLEGLQSTSSIPDEGMTIKSNNVALSNFFGTLDFSSDFTVTESPTGELNISIAASSLVNPMNAVGDTLYGGASGAATRLAGNTSTSRKFLRQTGDGAASAAPVWDTLVAGDIPNLSATYALAGHNHAGLYEPVLGFTAVPTTRTVNGHALSSNVTVTPADLGLVIGTNVQAYSARLGEVAAIGTALQQIRVNAGGTALEYFTVSGGGGGTWGSITGTLSDQIDLNTALGLKANAANPVFTGVVAVGGATSSFPGFKPRSGTSQLQLTDGTGAGSQGTLWAGQIYINGTVDSFSGYPVILNSDPSNAIQLSSNATVKFSDSSNADGTKHVGLAAHTTRTLRVTDGGGGSGDLVLRKLFDSNGIQILTTQGAAVADATDAASAITQLNMLLSRLRAHGLISN
jgi:hypothetical protein